MSANILQFCSEVLACWVPATRRFFVPSSMLKVIFNEHNFSPGLLMDLKEVLQDLDVVEI